MSKKHHHAAEPAAVPTDSPVNKVETAGAVSEAGAGLADPAPGSNGVTLHDNDLAESSKRQDERRQAFERIRSSTPAQILKIQPEPNATPLLGLLIREADSTIRTSRMISWSTEIVSLKPGDSAHIFVLAEGTDDLEQFEYWERTVLRNGGKAARAPANVIEQAEALKRADGEQAKPEVPQTTGSGDAAGGASTAQPVT